MGSRRRGAGLRGAGGARSCQSGVRASAPAAVVQLVPFAPAEENVARGVTHLRIVSVVEPA